MLALAGETIASIAGTTLGNMIISLVRDIGMTNTTYVDIDGSYESLPDMSQPYIFRNGTLDEFDIFQLRKVHVALGAAGILSTSNDMAKYMNFHLNQGRIGDRQIVPSNVMSWLYPISHGLDFQGGRGTDVDSDVYSRLGTAQGFISALYDGWNVIYHGGYLPPYHCDISMFPATRIGVFICANGPGALYNYPTLEMTSSSIFELVRGSNRSLEHIFSNKVGVVTPFIEHEQFEGQKTNRVPTVLHHSQIRDRIESEDVVGVYGHPYDDDLSIRYVPGTGNTTLQLYFSEWTYGRLEQVPGSNTSFLVEWETSIMDHYYSYPFPVPSFWIDFGIADTVLLRVGELNLYNEFEFVKNATLDTFPSIPWTPTSCGPE